MQVTRKMHDRELQGQYGALRFLVSMNKRDWGLCMVNRMVRMTKGQKVQGVDNDTVQVPSTHTQGHMVRTRVFRPRGSSARIPAMVYFHGGGYMMGIPEMANAFYADVLERREVAIFSPDYRLSRTDPFPAGFNDCYDVLLWVRDHADELNIDPNNIIIAGHSAGGGMAAAITLKARDTGDVKPIFQMPVYPMLDHRMITASSQMRGSTMWDAEINERAWRLYLQDLDGPVPPYASPALNEDFRDLPPTISFVGDLEPFLDENLAYIEGLKSAGVPVEFKVFKGGYHGFEVGSPGAAISKAANKFQLDAFEAFYDAYLR